MNILTAEHLQKAYTEERILLKDAAFSLQEGEKVGVIGVNGMGKSTLLKIIAGVEEPDQGAVIMGNHVKTAYLEQTPVLEDADSILKSALKGLDHHKRSPELHKVFFQPAGHFTVQMVGGLVQNQDFHRLKQDIHQRHPFLLAAG